MPHTSSQIFLRELDKKLWTAADKPAQYDEAIHWELEERDYYIEKNVFWVPPLAIRSDDTLVVRTKEWATGVSPLPNLAELIDLIATIPFQHADLHAKDNFGRAYHPATGPGGFFVMNTRPSGVRFAKRSRASTEGVVRLGCFIKYRARREKIADHPAREVNTCRDYSHD